MIGFRYVPDGEIVAREWRYGDEPAELKMVLEKQVHFYRRRRVPGPDRVIETVRDATFSEAPLGWIGYWIMRHLAPPGWAIPPSMPHHYTIPGELVEVVDHWTGWERATKETP